MTPQPEPDALKSNAYTARFGGIRRLYGKTGQEQLRRARVCIVGIGGVGSWAVEALARSGLGALTLVDLDEVCISNTNRQLQAVQGASGKPKVEVMAHRVRGVNPECAVEPIQTFFTAANAESLLATPFDCLVDAIDAVHHKCLLIARCRDRRIPVVTTGGAGGRRDPTRIRTADLAHSTHDALLQEVRRLLRREYGFPRPPTPFGVEAVFSTESQVFPTPDGEVCAERLANQDLRLDCTSGYGTASFVTGAFGFAAAALAVRRIVDADLSRPR